MEKDRTSKVYVNILVNFSLKGRLFTYYFLSGNRLLESNSRNTDCNDI